MSRPIIWNPPATRWQASHLYRFVQQLQQFTGETFKDYGDLHRWTLAHAPEFWEMVWVYGNVVGEIGDQELHHADDMRYTRWFADSKLNYAENLLRHRDDRVVVIAQQEDLPVRSLLARDLYEQTERLVQEFRQQGIGVGDRVAGYLPNIPETLVAMLATSAIGAIWSSASPDFGAASVIERFGQIKPKLMICADGYRYQGKVHSLRENVAAIREALPTLQGVIEVSVINQPLKQAERHWDTIQRQPVTLAIEFERLPFNAPLYILYSSGTTGQPKCIVHGAGGMLLQHLKEHQLHCDIQPGERVFYYTTCGWMMWNWLISALASDATLVLYDGSPFYPGSERLWQLAEDHDIGLFGTSAKYLDSLKKRAYRPNRLYTLGALKTLCSTGSVLSPEGFDFVYRAIKPDLHLTSISGGTDICSCFVLGNLMQPLRRGELQGPGLGMDVQVFDPHGKRIFDRPGELVCCAPFPAQPLGFWNDPEYQAYQQAYFDKYPNVWCHGDWVEQSPQGGFVFYGRSDATLNPGGVRIGSAEIYRVVEQLDEIQEALVVGQQWQGDERLILFVTLAPGQQLNTPLRQRISDALKQQCSARHVPAKILAVEDIPRTKSGKIVELAVREQIHGRPVTNLNALANPQALQQFSRFAELQQE